MVRNMLKSLLLVLFLAAFLPGEAVAQSMTVRDFFTRELREDGYENIRISRTFLGRLRFTGSQPGRRREIVVNPANGAILRDYVRIIGEGGNEGGGGNKPPYPGGGGYEDGDYDEDNDYDDDDYDEDDYDHDDYDDGEDNDDNSGSGSSNSGSGSSNSGSGSSNSGSGSDDDDDD